MNKEPITPEQDDIDKMESLFDEKPTSRLVWILPSVLLHLAVLAIWLSMPEEPPRVLEDRELVIKSEQAEQLKEFVEDANLAELRMEVKRLQDIKTSMQEIRAEQIATLKDFEKEMQKEVNADATQVLRQIEQTQNTILSNQRTVIQQMDKIENLFKAMDPHIAKKDFAQIAPLARQTAETRKLIKQHQDEAVKQLQFLQTQMDNADSVLSWLKAPELVKHWSNFIDTQEKVMELQSQSSDKQGQIKYNQEGSLLKLAEKGNDYLKNIQDDKNKDKKNLEDYERVKKEFSNNIANLEKEEQDFKKRLNDLDASMKKNQDEQNKIKNSLPPDSKKSNEDHQKRKEGKNKIQALAQENNRIKNQKNQVNNQYKQLLKRLETARNKSRQLKAPAKSNESQKLTDEMNRYLGSLGGKAGELNQQKEALKLEETAIKLNKELINKVKTYMEAKK